MVKRESRFCDGTSAIAIDKIVERCEDPSKKRGLVWHTQGSGKTFTLLTAARLILEQKKRFKNATVVLVVDRTELEGQLKGWVEKLLGEMQQQDIPVWRAGTKSEVQDLLKSDKRGLIISMIHKFEGIDKDTNTGDNIFVFIDEAHRSVAKDLGFGADAKPKLSADLLDYRNIGCEENPCDFVQNFRRPGKCHR